MVDGGRDQFLSRTGLAKDEDRCVRRSDLLRSIENILIYAQVPEGTTDSTKEGAPPVLHILDSDNLTVRERIRLAENLAGRSVPSSDSNTMYALSDSGVTVLPVGSLGEAHRVVASGEDMLFREAFATSGS